jgi:hypothetical protein
MLRSFGPLALARPESVSGWEKWREGLSSPTHARVERLLVALTPSPDLLVHAKDLFVEAMPLTWLYTQPTGADGFSPTKRLI